MIRIGDVNDTVHNGSTTGPARGRRGWLRPAAEIAGVVSAAVAVVMLVIAVTSSATQTPETPATNATTGMARPSNGTDRAAGDDPTYLDSLQPTAGYANLARLPRGITGKPGYGRAITIACPSNQTTDLVREVSYELGGRYHEFRATLFAYRQPADRVLVDLRLFRDPVDRMPGGGTGAEAYHGRLSVNETRNIVADMEGAYYLRLRVECGKPNGYIVLVDAAVT
jgi:hypothetical protein